MNRIEHPDHAAGQSIVTPAQRAFRLSSSIARHHSCQPGCSRRIPAFSAFIEGRLPGSLGLRPLAPLPSKASFNQRTLSNPVDLARPFHPSSPCQRLRLRAERIGGWTSFDFSTGVLGNGFRASYQYFLDQAKFLTLAVVFPVPDDRRDMHFPRGKVRSGPLTLIFPLFLRESGSLRKDSTFSKHT